MASSRDQLLGGLQPSDLIIMAGRPFVDGRAYDHVPGEPKPPAKPVQASQVSNERWRERVKNWLTTGKGALDA